MYKAVRTPFVGQHLETTMEDTHHDRFAETVIKDDKSEGHIS